MDIKIDQEVLEFMKRQGAGFLIIDMIRNTTNPS